MNLRELEDEAKRIGFDAVGVASVTLLSEAGGFLRSWLEQGKNAGMAYMANYIEKRVDPGLLVEGSRSVIVTLTNYYTDRKQSEAVPKIAKYAWGRDYHLVVKERLRQLLIFIESESGSGVQGRCFVDSAPVFEHEWARRAGLGWQGKNTLLINKDLGSFCFIGVIFAGVEFESYSVPFTASHCGSCVRCIAACPTGALSAYEVDARKCISYHTIENKSDYPEELREQAGDRIFGCDVCQDVCPWNKRAKEHRVEDFFPQDVVLSLTADDWCRMDEALFKQLFKNTALERTGLERVVRNINIDEGMR